MTHTTTNLHGKNGEKFTAQVKHFDVGAMPFVHLEFKLGGGHEVSFFLGESDGYDSEKLYEIMNTLYSVSQALGDIAAEINRKELDAHHRTLRLNAEFQATHQDTGDVRGPDWIAGFKAGAAYAEHVGSDVANDEKIAHPVAGEDHVEWYAGFHAGILAFNAD